MTLRVEIFKPEHIKHITDGRDDVEKKWEGIGISPLTRQHWMTDEHPAYTAFDGDRILGCAGVLILWDGFGEGWVWINKELAEKHALWFHKTVKGILWAIIKEYDLRRVQCTVDINYVMGTKWARALGFKEESQMPDCGPKGETFVRYVILTRHFKEG